MLIVGVVFSPAAAGADDLVLRWNEIAAQTATATTPYNQARVGAIVQLAVFVPAAIVALDADRDSDLAAIPDGQAKLTGSPWVWPRPTPCSRCGRRTDRSR